MEKFAQKSKKLHVSVSGPTVCRVLYRNNFTRKRIVQVAKQQSVEFRATFMSQTLQFPRKFFDETGSDGRNQVRDFGYALRGEAPVYHRFLVGYPLLQPCAPKEWLITV